MGFARLFRCDRRDYGQPGSERPFERKSVASTCGFVVLAKLGLLQPHIGAFRACFT
jgi:hypothetical protein